MQAFARESLPTKLMRLPGPFHNLAALAYPEQAKNRVVPYNCGACTASNPYAEMLSLSNVSRAKARDIRGFMHVVADCLSPLDVILRKCRLSLTKACRRRIYAFPKSRDSVLSRLATAQL